ncbi:MAG TPA: hypothetical protein PLL10_08655, partial [Elusimicrobiales bacterium]|nr:hypothetical protein [Elusimicrobiales bacterium]
VSSQLTLCAAPLVWFSLLGRSEPVLAPAIDSELPFWAGLTALAASSLRAILARNSKEAAGGITAACTASALMLIGLNNFEAAGLVIFSGLPACALTLAVADSVEKSLGTSMFSKLGRARFAMPATHFTALLATLSIAGLPPLSGFYALKIALSALAITHHPLGLFVFCLSILLLGAAAVRAFHLVFNGEHTQGRGGVEAPLPELTALMLLSCATIFCGWLFSRPAILPLIMSLPRSQGKGPLLIGFMAMLLAAVAVLLEIFYQTRWRWQRKESRRRPAEALVWLLSLQPLSDAAGWLLGLAVRLCGALENLFYRNAQTEPES